MAKKEKANQTVPHNVFEDPTAIEEKIVHAPDVVAQYRSPIVIGLTILVVVVGGYFWYRWYQGRQEKLAQEQLFPAQFFFEKDSLDKALNGDGNFTEGFLAIGQNYSGTKAADLANFYAGVIYMKQGKYEEAIPLLEDFGANDYLVQARAYALVGDAYVELDQPGKAVDYFKKAANHNPNAEFTPSYLFKLALAQEAIGDLAGAKASYQKLADEYEESQEGRNAKKYLAALGE